MKATTLPTLPTCYYVDCRAMAMYLVVVRPRIWASELRCAAHGGVRYCRANKYSEVGCVQKSKLFQMPTLLIFRSGGKQKLLLTGNEKRWLKRTTFDCKIHNAVVQSYFR